MLVTIETKSNYRGLKLSPEKVSMGNLTVHERVELMANQSLLREMPEGS